MVRIMDKAAAEAGVEVLAFTCRTTPDTLELADPVPVVFK